MSVRGYSQRVVVMTLLLTGVWYILSGRFDLLHFGTGVAAAVAIALNFRGWGDHTRFRAGRFVVFVPWLFVQIVKSNLRVARSVLTPGLAIDPTFIDREPVVTGDRGLTLLGMSITLTPGTLTVDIGEHDILVHSLDTASAQDIDEGLMEDRVSGVFEAPAS